MWAHGNANPWFQLKNSNAARDASLFKKGLFLRLVVFFLVCVCQILAPWAEVVHMKVLQHLGHSRLQNLPKRNLINNSKQPSLPPPWLPINKEQKENNQTKKYPKYQREDFIKNKTQKKKPNTTFQCLNLSLYINKIWNNLHFVGRLYVCCM